MDVYVRILEQYLGKDIPKRWQDCKFTSDFYFLHTSYMYRKFFMQQYELATMLLKVGHITSQISIFLKCLYPESWRATGKLRGVGGCWGNDRQFLLERQKTLSVSYCTPYSHSLIFPDWINKIGAKALGGPGSPSQQQDPEPSSSIFTSKWGCTS